MSTIAPKDEEVLAKRYVTPDEVQLLGLCLAKKVERSDFRPNWIWVLWRGGAPFGMTIQGYLAAKGIVTDHIPVRTSSYTAPGEQSAEIRVYAMNYAIETCRPDDRVLIVDDVFESGRSVAAVLDKARREMGANMPREVRVAVAFWKPHKNKTELVPDYVAEETSEWLVFPHEFDDLTPAEVRHHMGEAVHAAYAD